MELASINLARSIWLFDTAELNPLGKSVYPDLFTKLIDRYKFRTVPKAEDLISGKDRKFSHGQFAFGELLVEISTELWGDGLIADTRHSTEATDAFLDDALQWIAEELQIRYPASLVKKKAYRSEIVAYFSSGLSGMCAKLDTFTQELSGIWPGPDQQELSAVIFGSEAMNSSFTLERRINTPYAENKFFSAAQTDTARHLALLRKLEELFRD